MNRKQFIVKCGLCAMGLPVVLAGCAGTRYVTVPIEGDSLVVPTSSFSTEKQTLKYIVVQNDRLEYPVCVYRFADDDYKALLMKCTHQGTELQVFGDRLQCPAHGSEFTNNGAVQNGPADRPLRTFTVSVENDSIKIRLS
jgi:nitrite reductase/ring-hydroxylating ferredoxin subunit